jgi:hypothetical protein
MLEMISNPVLKIDSEESPERMVDIPGTKSVLNQTASSMFHHLKDTRQGVKKLSEARTPKNPRYLEIKHPIFRHTYR